jgi:hypothetical protein
MGVPEVGTARTMRPIELNFVAQGLHAEERSPESLHAHTCEVPIELEREVTPGAKFQRGSVCAHDKRRDRQRDTDDSK